MNRVIVFLFLIMTSLVSAVFAQDNKDIATGQFRVSGNCNMCKQRIEDAAYGKGVKSAEWDKTTGVLTIVYRPSKTSAADILQRVAAAGHDADTLQASKKAYEGLPACCSYRTHPHHH